MLGVCALKIRHSEKKLEKEFTNLFRGRFMQIHWLSHFLWQIWSFSKISGMKVIEKRKKLLKTVCVSCTVSNDAFHEFLLG